MVKKIACLLVIVTLMSCNKLDISGFISPGSVAVDKRFEQSMAWNQTHHPLTLQLPTDHYRFYVATDIHTETTTRHLQQFLTEERNDSTAYFSIILGDLINVKGAMSTVYDAVQWNPITQKSHDTLFTIAGNHDLMNHQWNDYQTYFGTSTYNLTIQTPAASDLFVFLDSSSGTLGRKQLAWLKNLLQEQRRHHRYCFVCSHVNLFRVSGAIISSGNFTVEETYELCQIFSDNHVNLVLQGHHHTRESVNFNNVQYLVTETLRDTDPDAGFLVVNCGQNVDYQFVKIKSLSGISAK